jgi:hypothetical protein
MQPAPAHVNQFSAGGVFQSGPRKGQSSKSWDCMVAVGMMALDAATGIRVSATDFRARQRDQVGGIGLNDVAEAWRSIPGAPKFSHGLKLWGSVANRLDRGDGVAMPGLYSALGDERGSTYRGGHAIYVQRRATGGYLVNDPIRRAPAVVSESAIRRFWLTGGMQAGWAEGVPTGGSSRGGSWEPAPGPGLLEPGGVEAATDEIGNLVVNGVVLVVVIGLGWAGVKRIVGGTTHAVLVEAPSAALKLPERILRG